MAQKNPLAAAGTEKSASSCRHPATRFMQHGERGERVTGCSAHRDPVFLRLAALEDNGGGLGGGVPRYRQLCAGGVDRACGQGHALLKVVNAGEQDVGTAAKVLRRCLTLSPS